MKYTQLLCPLAAATLLLTGCIDNDYDLSDIDTTSKVEVKDLTLPINMEPFTLEAMFDIDENDPDEKIKVIDGEYCVRESGSFDSKEIRIGRIHLNSIPGQSSETSINTGYSGTVPGGIAISLPFNTDIATVSYSTNSVPKEIVDVTALGANFSVSYQISIPELNGKVRKLAFKDVKVQFPKGLKATPNHGSYDSESGILEIDNLELTRPDVTLTLQCTGVDFKKIGGEFEEANHKASIDLELSVSGDLAINSSDLTGAMPSTITLRGTGSVSDMEVTSFSGKIRYIVDDVTIDPVDLSGLPDILDQEARISIANPQIYLALENPVGRYCKDEFPATTGFAINSNFTDGLVTNHPLDNGTFQISRADRSAYCLSPKRVTNVPDGYAGATHVGYHSLSTVLEGNGTGLPKTLDIALSSPTIDSEVDEFPLSDDANNHLGSVKGTYEFLAPLALGAGSKIVYTDTDDGWNDEDLDAVTISTLSISMHVKSDIPIDFKLEAYPIDAKGDQINTVKIEPVDIPAGCDRDIVIRITGEINHLDGITYTATGYVPEGMSSALSKNMSLNCTNIRATFSGYYVKEF